ncbi:hypothetical protein Tco_0593029 [Tanacetum coccineum]
MVAYLKKPTGSGGFQDIVDFLNGSHIRYAFTKNPTIYVSLIEKFWQTASVRKVDNGEQEINAIVDGKEFTITEASVRRHLQLAEADGISVLLNTKFFDQLTLMRFVLTDDKLTFQLDEAVYEEGDDRVERDTATAASLDAEQASAIMKVKNQTLENRIKSSKAKIRVRIIVSEDEGDLEDPSKQGRKIAQIDEDEGITLVQMGGRTQGG